MILKKYSKVMKVVKVMISVIGDIRECSFSLGSQLYARAPVVIVRSEFSNVVVVVVLLLLLVLFG